MNTRMFLLLLIKCVYSHVCTYNLQFNPVRTHAYTYTYIHIHPHFFLTNTRTHQTHMSYTAPAVRRSKRRRFKPLNWWRGERYQWERRASGMGIFLSTLDLKEPIIIPPETPVKQRKPRKKRSHSSKSKSSKSSSTNSNHTKRRKKRQIADATGWVFDENSNQEEKKSMCCMCVRECV